MTKQNNVCYMKPNLIIAGCQKSGTTWLHYALGKSKKIYASVPKELGYFNKPGVRSLSQHYLSNFPYSPGAQYYMESTPHYFQKNNNSFSTADNIRSALGNPKIILIFRNPVERYESAYIHHIMKERLPYSEFIDEFTDDQKLLTLGLYSDPLVHWMERFPNIGIFFYDDLVVSEASFMSHVMQFLGINNDISADKLRFRTNDKNIKTKSLKISWPKMPRITDSLRERLVEYYKEDVGRLQELTGRDLRHWITPDRTSSIRC